LELATTGFLDVSIVHLGNNDCLEEVSIVNDEEKVITRAGFIFRVLRLLVHYFKLNNHLMFWKMC
jgi:hypothetical protein